MPGVGDVAGEGEDLRALRELGASGLELVLGAGVDDEAPAAVGERVGERAAETPRGAGDDRGRAHAATSWRARVRVRLRAATACS